MLSSFPLLISFLKKAFEWLCFASLLALATAAFTWNSKSIFVGGEVYFVDGDCYARMTRVRLLQENPGTPIRHHTFENFPDGTRPHTTAPLDYSIAGLAQILRPFSQQPLALAGAMISPFLGIVALCFLALWARSAKIRFRWPMLLLFAVSPIISHAFLLGRPDHQSLLLLFLAVALCAEVRIWEGENQRWPSISAAAWAFALWTSLFEPLVLLIAVLLARLARKFLERSAAPPLKTHRLPLAIFCSIMAFAFLWDGLHLGTFDPAFQRWALNIGELAHGNPEILFAWTGWILALAPLLLLWQFVRKRNALCLFWTWLLLLLCGLTLWHVRWGYFLALSIILSLPWAFQAIRWHSLAWFIFIVSLWPVAQEWERTLYPNPQVARSRFENLADEIALRDAAIRLKDLPTGGVIAPWWFSPAIVWWSNQPCVGGTSHESLPGIIDSSKFYLSADFSEGEAILTKRHVSYVIAYEPSRVIANAAQVLGQEPSKTSIGKILYTHPSDILNLHPIYINRFFKVFQVTKQSPGSAPASGADVGAPPTSSSSKWMSRQLAFF